MPSLLLLCVFVNREKNVVCEEEKKRILNPSRFFPLKKCSLTK
jgi:hypothetical protein